MNNSKKWMATLDEDQYQWLADLVEETEVDGSTIIGECIDRQRKGDARQFKDAIIAMKVKIQLDKLNEKKATLEDEIRTVKLKLNGVKVPA